MTDWRDGRINRRSFLAGLSTSGLASLVGLSSLSSLSSCSSRSTGVLGPRAGPFASWSLISPRAQLTSAARFDVVVIGSGYGGAVTAARLAGPQRSVCVLERGKEWLPGDFPETASELSANRTSHTRLGLLDLYTPERSDLDIVAASGIGGTSLINAAVSIRPEAQVYERPEWPRAIRQAHAAGELEASYRAAENVLHPGKYTGGDVRKTALLRALAAQRGGAFSYLPLNTTYRDTARPELPGFTQHACRLCGNCTTGCNYGAKGTLQASYLPLARARGAQLFAGIEVDWIEPLRDGGYRVHYDALDELGHEAGHVDASAVLVAAGSLGSTHLLMRSASRGLPVSAALGSRVSANGNVLGFSYNGARRTNIAGQRRGRVDGSVGNALMAYLDFRNAHAPGPLLEDRFLLIEGTIPAPLVDAVAKAFAIYALGRRGDFTNEQLRRSLLDLGAPDGAHPDGALNHSTLYLASGHDDSGGRYVYRNDARPRIEWGGLDSSRFFSTINAEMAAFSAAQGGHYIENPRSALFGGRLMAPHPLGGCPMGDDAQTGVVDHAGRVFDPRRGGAVHRGLYVMDASVIPRSLGSTPLLTICALAERAAPIIAAELPA